MVQDIDWLKSITNLPILIKGVLTGEDGKIYLEIVQSSMRFRVRRVVRCPLLRNYWIIVYSVTP